MRPREKVGVGLAIVISVALVLLFVGKSATDSTASRLAVIEARRIKHRREVKSPKKAKTH